VNQMLRNIIILILAMISLVIIFTVKNTDDSSARGGGKTDNTDPNAPKVINSSEMLSFSCAFSTAERLKTETLGRYYFTLEAVLRNGTVTGSYQRIVKSSPDETVSGSFEADAAFMAELQAVVAEGDLAKYNGLSIRVGGLPPRLGCSLHITYASGEEINAQNNQTNFLALEEMTALEALFRQAAFGEN